MSGNNLAMLAINNLRDDLRETERALSDCAGSIRELSAMVTISQQHNDRRLAKLERLGVRLLIGVLLLSGGGAITGQIVARMLGS